MCSSQRLVEARRSGEGRAGAYCVGAMANEQTGVVSLLSENLPRDATSPQSGIKLSISIALVCATPRRITASATTNKKPEKRRFDPALMAGDRGEHRDRHVLRGTMANAARGLGGSSNPPLKHVRFALAERRIRLCHPRNALNSRPDLSSLAAQIPRARLQASAWIHPLAHHPGTFLSFFFSHGGLRTFLSPQFWHVASPNLLSFSLLPVARQRNAARGKIAVNSSGVVPEKLCRFSETSLYILRMLAPGIVRQTTRIFWHTKSRFLRWGGLEICQVFTPLLYDSRSCRMRGVHLERF